jgi:hypothetical protein
LDTTAAGCTNLDTYDLTTKTKKEKKWAMPVCASLHLVAFLSDAVPKTNGR